MSDLDKEELADFPSITSLLLLLFSSMLGLSLAAYVFATLVNTDIYWTLSPWLFGLGAYIYPWQFPMRRYSIQRTASNRYIGICMFGTMVVAAATLAIASCCILVLGLFGIVAVCIAFILAAFVSSEFGRYFAWRSQEN